MSKGINSRKVAVIGTGFVGSSSAFALMESGLFTEMVLIDADKNRAEGEALDIAHGLPFARPMKITAGDYDDIVDAAIIVVTAGAGQKPGETRLDPRFCQIKISAWRTFIGRCKICSCMDHRRTWRF